MELLWSVRRASVLKTSTGALWCSIAPTKDVIKPLRNVCWNKMRNTSSAIDPISRPKRTLARAISRNAITMRVPVGVRSLERTGHRRRVRVDAVATPARLKKSRVRSPVTASLRRVRATALLFDASPDLRRRPPELLELGSAEHLDDQAPDRLHVVR